jgi:hypothetical protein
VDGDLVVLIRNAWPLSGLWTTNLLQSSVTVLSKLTPSGLLKLR